ncbi:uncharacterized protein LAJ45_07767 [Morchella importuna]|uniref:uncharacterized protein n=1 Tax=Morchella importuna TaxID=1174673 RepID=UPI001E8E690F|nr:uncharacterized protein LAJ45_07767 [Morchella importuna]KAH8148314.1 hypothetical protein LAJ45_07767 [Morchella importuna]
MDHHPTTAVQPSPAPNISNSNSNSTPTTPSNPAAPSSTSTKPTHTTAPQLTSNNAPLALAPPLINPPSGGSHNRPLTPTFTVAPVTGTMSLSLPLPVTPVPRATQISPTLSLGYDSGNGNGVFGVGWRLGGAGGSISRKVSRRVPTYNDAEEDRDRENVFLISDAEDLVPLLGGDVVRRWPWPLAAGGEDREYKVRRFLPRVESGGVRIERWTAAQDAGDVFWRVITADNVTTVYGLNDSSRIFCAEEEEKEQKTSGKHKRIFKWLACWSVDAAGNAVSYTYKPDDTSGLRATALSEAGRSKAAQGRNRYLKSIHYGNRTPWRHLDTWDISPPALDHDSVNDWMFRVVLDYGEHDDELPTEAEVKPWGRRSDPFSSYTSGFEIRTSRLCRRVLMFHYMPEVFGKEEGASVLVNSTQVQYEESGTASFVSAVTHSANTAGIVESLPPYTFTYTTPSPPSSLRLRTADTSALLSLPGSTNSTATRTQWLDLDSDGVPGLLISSSSSSSSPSSSSSLSSSPASEAWLYHRNLSPASSNGLPTFSPPRLLTLHPAPGCGPTHFFEDLDGNGHLDAVFTSSSGLITGFSERRTTIDSWDDFTTFLSIINLDNRGSPDAIRRIDLTGNGLSDILLPADEVTDELIWHESLAKAGFGPQRRTKRAGTGTGGPRFPPAGDIAGTAVFLADMSGDGLADVVHVSCARVAYWPNLGHGRFGDEVVMDNAPVLDGYGQFSTERVRMADIDGTGTADLIYLPAPGGVKVYRNLAGNGWSDGETIDCFPKIDDLSSVFTLDLLGQGTSCLCWTGPDVLLAAEGGGVALRYLDLMGGQKPHLLKTYTNGLGASVDITYRPSTWYHQTDEQAGKPWKTRLPFPVHCVSQLKKTDEIAMTATTTRYAYHHGFYDGVEREFRGFGMVEQFDSDEFTTSANAERPFRRPTVHTKSWFHAGAVDGDGAVPDGPSFASHPPRLQPSCLPASVTPDERREVFRALKGSLLRQEIYSDDGTAREALPYVITECRQTVHRTRSPTAATRGVYRVTPLETLATHYERRGGATLDDDPRVVHGITLEVNEFGDVVKSASVVYGRRRRAGGNAEVDMLPAEVREMQETAVMSYSQIQYTNKFDKPDLFRKPSVAASQQYRIRGFKTAAVGVEQLLRVEELTRDDFSFFRTAANVPPEQANVPATSPPTTAAQKILTAESRTYYRSSDLLYTLPLGDLEPFSIMDQAFTLCTTSSLLTSIYGDGAADTLRGLPTPELMSLAGLVALDSDSTRWWVPSSRSLFADEPAMELHRARSAFYTPTIAVDAFGKRTYTVLDGLNLLPVKCTDALGNTTTAVHDYRRLAPRQVTDANGNRVQIAMDGFGNVVGMARMGKEGEAVGDSLDGFQPCPTQEQLDAFLADPAGPLAVELLGAAGSRTIFDRSRFHRSKAASSSGGGVLPSFAAEITRDVHHHNNDSSDEPTKLLIKIHYLDGLGIPLQSVTLMSRAPDNDNRPLWLLSGWEIRDDKGRPVRRFQPTQSPSHHFRSQNESADVAATTLLYDAVDRVVGTLNPDRTWNKVVHGPWVQRMYDEGDTVLCEDPAGDVDIGGFVKSLDRALVVPSWHGKRQSAAVGGGGKWERDAASKAAIYHDTPTVVHLDVLGRPILTIRDNGSAGKVSEHCDYDLAGNMAANIDALGRVVERRRFDLLGRPVHSANMDSGERWAFLDCYGNPLLEWNSRGVRRRTTYDALRREKESWVIDAAENSSNTTQELLVRRTVYGEELEDEGHALSHNLKGRPVRTYDQSGLRTNISFDFKGNCTRSSAQTAVEYKTTLNWNNPLEVALHLDIYTSTVHFDALDHPVRSTDHNGAITKRTFGLMGELQSVHWRSATDPGFTAYITSITYDPNGQPLRIAYGNACSSTFTYDRCTQLLTRKRTVRESSGGDAVLEDITYTHDCLGRITHTVDSAHQAVFFRNCRIDPACDYTYDALGRLVAATGREQLDCADGGDGGRRFRAPQPLSPSAISTLPADATKLCEYVETYQYDPAGNMLKMTHSAANDPLVSGWTRRFVYDEPSLLLGGGGGEYRGNRLSRTELGRFAENYAYGASGCVTAMPGFSEMGWDYNERLRSSATQVVRKGEGKTPETTWYVYSSDGVRVRKVTESAGKDGEAPRRMKETLYFPLGEIFRTFGSDGVTVKSEMITSEVVGTKRIALVESITIPSGSSSARSTSGGGGGGGDNDPDTPPPDTLIRRLTTAPSKYRYRRYPHDTETGLLYCSARYYMPWLGRWLSPDPIGILDGLNTYLYVNDDPVNYFDPSGTYRDSDDESDDFIDSDDEGQHGDSEQEDQEPAWDTAQGLWNALGNGYPDGMQFNNLGTLLDAPIPGEENEVDLDADIRSMATLDEEPEPVEEEEEIVGLGLRGPLPETEFTAEQREALDRILLNLGLDLATPDQGNQNYDENNIFNSEDNNNFLEANMAESNLFNNQGSYLFAMNNPINNQGNGYSPENGNFLPQLDWNLMGSPGDEAQNDEDQANGDHFGFGGQNYHWHY